MENRKFIIPESAGLNYRILLLLDDLGVEYEYVESEIEDSIILNPIDVFKYLPKLQERSKVPIRAYEKLRNGEILDTPIDLSKCILGIVSFGNWNIDIFTGSWLNTKSGEQGNLGKALMNYGRAVRSENIILSDGIRTVLSWGTIGDDIIDDITDINRSPTPYYHEVLHSTVKLKFLGDNPEQTWKTYITNPVFPRSIPWRDGKGNYGIWVWPERYYSLLKGDSAVYPKTELVLIDSKYYDREISISLGSRNKIYQVSENPLTIIYTPSFCFSLRLGYCKPSSTSKIPVSGGKEITTFDYTVGSKELQDQVEDIFSVFSDSGILTPRSKTERKASSNPLKPWIDLGFL